MKPAFIHLSDKLAYYGDKKSNFWVMSDNSGEAGFFSSRGGWNAQGLSQTGNILKGSLFIIDVHTIAWFIIIVVARLGQKMAPCQCVANRLKQERGGPPGPTPTLTADNPTAKALLPYDTWLHTTSLTTVISVSKHLTYECFNHNTTRQEQVPPITVALPYFPHRRTIKFSPFL